jgi:hypothetical protein
MLNGGGTPDTTSFRRGRLLMLAQSADFQKFGAFVDIVPDRLSRLEMPPDM